MMVSGHTKSYSDLQTLETFEDRYEYLRLGGGVGVETFGSRRGINQDFYASRQWKDVRRYVILRDNGCDLGVPGHDIAIKPTVHHMNAMTPDDIIHGELWILDPEYLITVTEETHNAIHYGSDLVSVGYIERHPGDTTPW